KVEKAIKKYGYDYTRGAVLYTNTNAKSSFGKYFDGTIAQNWHEEFMGAQKEQLEKEELAKEKKAKLESKQLEIKLQESQDQKNKEAMKAKYLSLPEEEQSKIEKIVYSDYITKAGGNATKTVKNSFERAKLALIAEYLKEVKYFENENKILEFIEILPVPEPQAMKRDIDFLVGGLAGTLTTEVTAMKRVDIPVAEIVKPVVVIEEEKITEDKIKIEKQYPDLLTFKFDAFGYLDNKLSIEILKKIMSFLNIESYFKTDIDGYRIELKFVKDGESLIFVEKLS
ncbi:MAG: hypothetical protein ACRC0V_04105, partial [Fusobacteriaceae bacterium]